MNSINILEYYNSIIYKLTSKTVGQVNITDFTKTNARQGTFSTPVGWSDNDIKYSVLVFDNGYCRVIDTANSVTGTTTVTWKQSLDSFITVDASIILMATPLADCNLYVGNGDPLGKVVSLNIVGAVESDFAMAGKKEITNMLTLTYDYSIVNGANYKSDYYTFLYGIEQLSAVVTAEAICSYRAVKTGFEVKQTQDKDERLNKTIDKFKAIISFEIKTYNV